MFCNNYYLLEASSTATATATIATFFLTNSKKQKNTYKNDIIDNIKIRLDDFDSITKEELKDMFNVLKILKDNEE